MNSVILKLVLFLSLSLEYYVYVHIPNLILFSIAVGHRLCHGHVKPAERHPEGREVQDLAMVSILG